MFAGFDLTINFLDFFHSVSRYSNCDKCELIAIGKSHLKRNKKAIDETIKSVLKNGEIDGNKIKEEWFPVEEKVDIFISHSHDDIDEIHALVGWIHKTFDLNCFVDSNLWYNVRDVISELNDSFNPGEMTDCYGKIYSYENTQHWFEHGHVMLMIALQQMMDKAETIFLINTRNSVRIGNKDGMNATYSPWIYAELCASKIIRKKPLICYRDLEFDRFDSVVESKSVGDRLAMILVNYHVDLQHLHELKCEDLFLWQKKYRPDNFRFEARKCLEKIGDINSSPLDYLYSMKGIKDEFDTRAGFFESLNECTENKNWHLDELIDNVRKAYTYGENKVRKFID